MGSAEWYTPRMPGAPAKYIKLAAWLLAIGYSCLLGPTASSQNSSPAGQPTSLKEFQDNGALYFPAGTFKKPDGSPDEHSGDGLAWHLRRIGEPPLAGPADNSQTHAYRLVWIGFPAGKMAVIRLKIENDGSAKVFAKQTPFDKADLLFAKEDSVPVEGVNRFLECVKRADFWKLPTREQHEPRVVDGSYWYLEGVRQGDYHMVYRRYPEGRPGPFTDMGRYLAKDLAQLADSVIRIPRGDRSEPIRRRVTHP
jgi:hypothetical protein